MRPECRAEIEAALGRTITNAEVGYIDLSMQRAMAAAAKANSAGWRQLDPAARVIEAGRQAAAALRQEAETIARGDIGDVAGADGHRLALTEGAGHGAADDELDPYLGGRWSARRQLDGRWTVRARGWIGEPGRAASALEWGDVLASDAQTAIGLARAERREQVWVSRRERAASAEAGYRPQDYFSPGSKLRPLPIAADARTTIANGDEAAAAGAVRAHGEATGHEASVATWPDMSPDEVIVATSDSDNDVGLPIQIALRAVNRRDRAMTVHHNHPQDWPLSASDLDSLLALPGLGRVVAHTPTGAHAAAARVGAYRGAIVDTWHKVALLASARAGMPERDLAEAFVIALDEAGLISEQGARPRQWVNSPETVRAVIDEIVDGLARIERRPLDGEYGNLPDRPAAERQAGGLASFSGRDAEDPAANRSDPGADPLRGNAVGADGGARPAAAAGSGRSGGVGNSRGRGLADAARRVAERLGADDFDAAAGDLWSAARGLRGHDDVNAPEDFAAALAREIDDVSPAARRVVPNRADIVDLQALIDRGAGADEILSSAAYRAMGVVERATPPTMTAAQADDPAFWAGRRYVIDGEQVSAETLVELLPEVFIASGAGADAVRQERRAVIVAGYPGAGKSSFITPLSRDAGAAFIDADKVKEFIPGYDHGFGTQAVHSESAALRLLAFRRMLERGTNILLERVGDQAQSLRDSAAELRAAGYRVDLVFIDVSPDEAVRRASGRFLARGRFISPSVYARILGGPERAFAELAAEANFDGIVRIDANGPPDQARIVDALGDVDALTTTFAGAGIRDGRQSGFDGRRGGSAADAAARPDRGGNAGGQPGGDAAEQAPRLTLPPRLAALDPTLSDLVDELAAARADLDDAEAQGLIDAATAAAARADSPDMIQLPARTELARAAAFCLTNGA
jgi:predicted ABC-type ATPase